MRGYVLIYDIRIDDTSKLHSGMHLGEKIDSSVFVRSPNDTYKNRKMWMKMERVVCRYQNGNGYEIFEYKYNNKTDNLFQTP